MDDEKHLISDKDTSPITYDDSQNSPGDIICHVQVESHHLKIYKRRWYILIIFCICGFIQPIIWNTWAPIAQSANDLFGWKNNDIALLTNWGPITYILTIMFFSWLIDVKGIRPTCLLTALFLFIGAGLRCITLDQPYVKWLINAGQLFNGLSGPFVMSAPPVLSSVWFPLHQRFTATAISTMVVNLGVSASLFVGCFVVTSNSSHSYNGSDTISNYETDLTFSTEEDLLKKEKKEIRTLLFAEFIICTAILVMVLVYFPNKPPTPPTTSAAIPRLEFKEGFKKLMKNCRFWMLGCVYAISSGVTSGWLAVLFINLKTHNISQEVVGMVSIYIGIGGCLGAILFARLADMFVTYARIFIIALDICAVLGFIWFQLMYTDILKMTLVPLNLSVTIPIILLTSTYPLLFELSCELAFPVAEGITTGILNLLSNMVTLLFLGILMIPNISTSWMNWVMLVSACCTIPILLLLKNEYTRFKMDKIATNQSPNDANENSVE